MKIKWSEHITTAVDPEGYPKTALPEIAVVGRSNVGKSSVINSLLNRKSLARVADTPGKTRQINFFNMEDKLVLVDLPGYGYAKVSKEEKKKWYTIVESYLSGRSQLKLIIMIVDIRHEPSGDDKLMYDWICMMGKPHIILANKSDKLSKSHIINNIKKIRAALKIVPGVLVIPFSAKKKTGRSEIWNSIIELMPVFK